MAILSIHEDGDLDGFLSFDIMRIIHIAKARLTKKQLDRSWLQKKMFLALFDDGYLCHHYLCHQYHCSSINTSIQIIITKKVPEGSLALPRDISLITLWHPRV